MSNSVSHSELRFLFDENADKRLERFLKQEGLDAISKPKRLANGKLAEFSKSEERILVTNDDDFINSEQFPKEKIFSVVWLRIPQDKPKSLLREFSKLLKEKTKPEDFEGFLIILKEEGFEVFPIKSVSEFVPFTK